MEGGRAQFGGQSGGSGGAPVGDGGGGDPLAARTHGQG